LPEHAPGDAEDRPDVEPPSCREAAVELVRQGHPVLEEVEDPDRQQEVAEDGADEAAGARQDGEEDGDVDGGRAGPALADAPDQRINPFSDRTREPQAAG